MADNSDRPHLREPANAGAPAKPIDLLRTQLARMDDEFRMGLPRHIPVDRFKRVVLTAANGNPDLLGAHRRSLIGACMRAAQDGLLPDGREGALVIFNTKQKDDQGKEYWIKAVQWMPMVYGIIKKMRNSGELASIVAHEVYKEDHFKYTLGDDERIEHEPYMGPGDPGPIIAAYAVARFKDGTIQREVMTRAQIDRVRAVSRSKDKAPWVEWFGEMARKTVTRRLSKYLPTSTEIEDLLRRSDLDQIADDRDEPRGAITIDGEAEDRRYDSAPAAPEDKPAEEGGDASDSKQSQAEAPTSTRRPPAPRKRADPDHDPETGEIKDDASPADDRGELFQ